MLGKGSDPVRDVERDVFESLFVTKESKKLFFFDALSRLLGEPVETGKVFVNV